MSIKGNSKKTIKKKLYLRYQLYTANKSRGLMEITRRDIRFEKKKKILRFDLGKCFWNNVVSRFYNTRFSVV
jgi:hypothetical protein